jgi:exopolysaccharide production protein ExoQ
MNPNLAFLIFSIGVAGLFFLNRDTSVRTSPALWLPVIWLWIVGSRPVSLWLGMGSTSANVLDATLNGSPVDAAIFAALLFAGILVLLHRKKITSAYLALSGPITVYFLYCLLSVAWSPFHEPAFKRWTKAVGDLVMVLLILTDGQPIAALRRVYSRVAFIIFPFSVFMIRYTFTGRGYDADGNPMNVGVTTNKNDLGLIVFVISLGILWNMRWLFTHRDEPHRGRKLLAQLVALGFGGYLLQTAHSATSVTCFLLGAGLMFATSLKFFKNRPGRVLALSLAVVLAGGLGLLLGGGEAYSKSLGRGGGLSGRTDIWAASIAAAGNPIIGTGFESFWNANAPKVNSSLQRRGFRDLHNLNSAHNGYIELYLDLGLVGLGLVVLILISGYRSASKAFLNNPELGSLLLACIATGTFFSITEVGFRILTPSWIFLLLGVVGSAGVANGVLGAEVPQAPVSQSNRNSRTPARNKLALEEKSVFPSRRRKGQFEIDRVNRIEIDPLPA